MSNQVKKIFKDGILDDHAIFKQVIGICSALAVTNLMTNSLIMGLGVMFVTAFSSMTVSALRNYTPKHIRMMVQVLIISAYVIILDIVLKAYYPDMSKALGPYVGLIITNCIIMGRAEAYAQKNTPGLSFLDGLASGMGYTLVLLAVAFIRELLGFGTLFGYQILGTARTSWTIMIMPPGAFFVLAILLWIFRTVYPEEEKKGGTA